MRKNRAMHQVAVLALDRVMPFECSIPHRILGSARDAAGNNLYAVATCSLDGRPVRTAADFDLNVAHGAELLATAETIVIPPFGSPDEPLDPRLQAHVAQLLGKTKVGARVVTLCGAAYLLAATGRLDDLHATTHWSLTAAFRQAFPRVVLEPDVLFVDNGPVITAAGAAAGIDCCLHLVRRDHGAQIANAVARHCVVPPYRDGGQQQFIQHPVPPAEDASTLPVRTWAMDHLDQPLPLTELAARANMSVRTFTRRFRDETGTSPTAWILGQRIDLARRLLEVGDLSVECVATQAGFGTPAGLRAHFATHVGVSPSAYRRTFRGANTMATPATR